jgi:hypothetical protein
MKTAFLPSLLLTALLPFAAVAQQVKPKAETSNSNEVSLVTILYNSDNKKLNGTLSNIFDKIERDASVLIMDYNVFDTPRGEDTDPSLIFISTSDSASNTASQCVVPVKPGKGLENRIDDAVDFVTNSERKPGAGNPMCSTWTVTAQPL